LQARWPRWFATGREAGKARFQAGGEKADAGLRNTVYISKSRAKAHSWIEIN
jgi:hypothetical protein